MVVRYLLILSLLLSVACAPVEIPPGTVMIADNSELLEIAEITADFVGAPEECRDWDSVGVYWAHSDEDFEEISGYPYSHAYGIMFAHVDKIDSIIFLSSRSNSIVIGHEILHHINDCLGIDDGEHDSPIWQELEGHIYDLACSYEVNPYAAGPSYEIQRANPEYIRCEPGGSF